MGVSSTYCQLCALPAQHDHYVPSAAGHLRIHRGSLPAGGHDWDEPLETSRPFAFGAEHAWLRDVVVVQGGPRPLRGFVEDGVFVDRESGAKAYVFEGDEEGVTLHHACWQLLGAPTAPAETLRGRGLLAWARVDAYRGQLFEFATWESDGKAGWLVDPTGDSPAAAASRRRISDMAEARRRTALRSTAPAAVADVLARDCDWRGVVITNGNGERDCVMHLRTALHRGLDCAAFPHLVQVAKDYPLGAAPGGLPTAEHGVAIENLETTFQHTLEHDRCGIAACFVYGGGKALLFAQTSDPAEARRRVESLPWAGVPGGMEVNEMHDPGWDTLAGMLGW